MEKWITAALLALLLSLNQTAWAKKVTAEVTVTAAFIEMHTGPGRGYPIFHIIEKNEAAIVIKSRTKWFKVQAPDGQVGWVHRSQMADTVNTKGEPFLIPEGNFGQYVANSVEVGLLGGDFSGASSLTGIVAYRFTANLSAELNLMQATGDFSDSKAVTVSIINDPWPQWRASPYFGVGAGMIRTEPSSTLVQTEDRTDNLLNVTGGVRVYLTRKFIFRLEYKHNVILTSRDNNEAVREWKAGFSVYF